MVDDNLFSEEEKEGERKINPSKLKKEFQSLDDLIFKNKDLQKTEKKKKHWKDQNKKMS